MTSEQELVEILLHPAWEALACPLDTCTPGPYFSAWESLSLESQGMAASTAGRSKTHPQRREGKAKGSRPGRGAQRERVATQASSFPRLNGRKNLPRASVRIKLDTTGQSSWGCGRRAAQLCWVLGAGCWGPAPGAPLPAPSPVAAAERGVLPGLQPGGQRHAPHGGPPPGPPRPAGSDSGSGGGAVRGRAGPLHAQQRWRTSLRASAGRR